jgi:ubiquinone/menaquinone biosynthesis C-methylase UbiE
MNKRQIYYLLSPKLRRLVRRMYYFPIDLYEKISHKRDDITPPKGKIFIGPGDFLKIGEKLKNDFVIYGGLQPHHYVLDIGCGIGRIAIPLTKYLNSNSKYEGIDIVKEGIDWCQKKINPKYPNFNFTHIDLQNDLYNLETQNKASEFKFHFSDSSFDFIILTSVFTHMQEADVINYLGEISRLLKKGGKCFVTFFIIDEHAKSFLNSSSKPFFPFEFDHYYLHNEKVKDANIAYKSDFIFPLISSKGLETKFHHKGWWCGNDKNNCVDFQDVLILEKI